MAVHMSAHTFEAIRAAGYHRIQAGSYRLAHQGLYILQKIATLNVPTFNCRLVPHSRAAYCTGAVFFL